MNHTLAQNIGVDISKDFLDVATSPAGEAIRFANDAKGHRALIKRLAAFEVIRVVFEATGAYHRLFERTLAKPGVSPKPQASSPKPTDPTPPCSPAWARRSSWSLAPSSARRLMSLRN